MVKIVKQIVNSDEVILGIYGDSPEEIKGRVDSLFNWGAIGRTSDLGCPERFVYAVTTKARVIGYFENLARMQWDCDRLEGIHFQKFIRELAEKAFDSLESEVFVKYGQTQSEIDYRAAYGRMVAKSQARQARVARHLARRRTPVETN